MRTLGADPIQWPAIVAAVAVGVQAVVVAVALAFARQQLREARDLREAQTRPFVVVDFDIWRVRTIIHLVVTNHGSTIARNVRFSFEPPLTSSLDDDGRSAIADTKLLGEGMPTLAPGAEIPILFDSALSRRSPHSDTYKVTLTYFGEGKRQYTDEILLDLGIYSGLHYIDRKEMHDLVSEVHNIAETVKRWSAGFDGLHVRTDADLESEQADRLRRFEERKAAREAADRDDGA